jgi:biotin transporter BioY
VQKLLVFSILLASFVIPLITSRATTTKAAVRNTVIASSAVCVLYLLGLMFLYEGVKLK